MAVTRIWPIKGYVGDVISYAANKNKTDFSKLSEEQQALFRSLHYVENEEKTEQKLLVEGINCDPEFAAEQMMNTKELYGKTDGIVAYHGYISFKPDEVEPKQAQKIAMEIADKMWGDDYEIVVATHMNAHCVHCHIVINSVSMTDGKKMNENKAMYQKFREVSDDKCREYGLSVIENPNGKRIPYNVYKAKQKGIKTKYDRMKEDIDFAITVSTSLNGFFRVMAQKGYTFDNVYDQNRYSTVRYRSDKHGVRLVNLGEQYTLEAIICRIKNQNRFEVLHNSHEYRLSLDYNRYEKPVYQYRDAYFLESGSIYINPSNFYWSLDDAVKTLTGYAILECPVIALLLITMIFAGLILEKYNNDVHPKSPEMKLSEPRLELISKQMDLALNEKLYSFDDVEKFIFKKAAELEKLKYERSKIYNKIRRCNDPEQKENLIAERNRLTETIAEKREELTVAKRIISDRPDLEARTEAEKQMMREWYFPDYIAVPKPPKSRHRDDGAR